MIGRICIVLGTLYCLHGAEKTFSPPEQATAEKQGKPSGKPLAAGLDLPALGLAGLCVDQGALCKELALQTVTYVVGNRLDTPPSPSGTQKIVADGQSFPTPLSVSAPLPPRRITSLEREALKQRIMRAI